MQETTKKQRTLFGVKHPLLKLAIYAAFVFLTGAVGLAILMLVLPFEFYAAYKGRKKVDRINNT